MLARICSLIKDLEVVWEFWASCIARVHCDGYKAVGIEFEHGPLKVKVLQLQLDGPLDAENLLGNYREHLQLNTVELIKACPRTRWSQTFKKLWDIAPKYMLKMLFLHS